MDAAFKLFAAPAAAAGVGSSGWDSGARLAANAGVALVIEREAGDAVLGGVGFDARPIPVGENADLLHQLAGGEFVVLNFLQAGAGGRLLAAKTGEPPRVGLERAHKRLDFADGARLGGFDGK